MDSRRRYLLVSPCRDEARFIRRTLDSVARQTIPPAKWIVVDQPGLREVYPVAAHLPVRVTTVSLGERPGSICR